MYLSVSSVPNAAGYKSNYDIGKLNKFKAMFDNTLYNPYLCLIDKFVNEQDTIINLKLNAPTRKINSKFLKLNSTYVAVNVKDTKNNSILFIFNKILNKQQPYVLMVSPKNNFESIISYIFFKNTELVYVTGLEPYSNLSKRNVQIGVHKDFYIVAGPVWVVIFQFLLIRMYYSILKNKNSA